MGGRCTVDTAQRIYESNRRRSNPAPTTSPEPPVVRGRVAHPKGEVGSGAVILKELAGTAQPGQDEEQLGGGRGSGEAPRAAWRNECLDRCPKLWTAMER